MDIKELKSKITLQHILEILEELGAEPRQSSNENVIQCKTICHGGDSHKLYLYKDSLNFHCYTNCESMDILTFLCKVLDCGLSRAMEYICTKFGLYQQSYRTGFGKNIETEDNYILDTLLNTRRVIKQDTWKQFKTIPDGVLNQFYDFYHESFYKDNISVYALQKFEVKHDILNQRVIIPHRYTDGKLIAVRCRNLDEELIASGRKYMPIIYENKVLSAPSGQYFYGLYFNKSNIEICKKIVLVEAEKSVLQYETMFPDANIAVALSGSNLSQFQIQILKDLGVEEVILALDKEYEVAGTEEERLYANKVKKTLVNRLDFCRVSILWDTKGLLKKKDSPTDRGKEVFLELYKNRIYV